MRLFIAEKPLYGKVIAEALGGGRSRQGYIECGSDIVTWCIGHLLELVPPKEINPAYAQWQMADLPMELRPARLRPIARTAAQFEVVRELISKATEIVNAGDPDDEGQLLVDEVLEYCHVTVPVKRFLLKDPNVSTAIKALNSMTDNRLYEGLSRKALARSVADYIYGLNMTRAYTIAARERGYDDVISIGRVQTTVLSLMVNRYFANKSHVAVFYHNVTGDMAFAGGKIKARLINETESGWPLDDKGRISDKAFAQELAASCAGKPADVADSIKKPKKQSAPLPFSLLDLQIEMSKAGISSEKTLEITQVLKDKHRAISYNRSDCRFLTQEQYSDAPETIQHLTNRFPEYAEIQASGQLDPAQKSRAFDDSKVSAHTGIIPTKTVPDPTALNTEERAVYNAIVLQYLAQFMPAKESVTVTVTFNCNNHVFAAQAMKITEPGWFRWLRTSAGDDKDKEEASPAAFDFLETLKPGDSGQCATCTSQEEKTPPPPLYTEATLLNDLKQVSKYVQDPRVKALLISRDEGKSDEEKGGIGTPATRAGILTTLQERNYFRFDKKAIVPTELGISLIRLLPMEMKTPDMTALWHEQQVMIEEGRLSVDSFLDGIEDFVSQQVKKVDVTGLKITLHKCDCGGHYRRMKGEHGVFWGCSNYPECKKRLPDKNGTPDYSTITSPCPVCKSKLILTPMTVKCSKCEFILFRTIFGKELTVLQLDALLSKPETVVMKGFKNKDGKRFDASLRINRETWKVEPVFNNTQPRKEKKVSFKFKI
jgi:DNA topoisomerase-3